MKMNAEKTGCNRHVTIDENEYFKLFRMSFEIINFYENQMILYFV